MLFHTEDAAILIDGRTRQAGPTVIDYIKSQEIDHLDIVIGTHPHADHIGDLIKVLETFSVGEVIDPAVVHTTRTFEEYLLTIERKDIPFTKGRAGLSRSFDSGIELDKCILLTLPLVA